MTRDLTDQKGWVSSTAIRWYRYSLLNLYRFLLFHVCYTCIFNKMKYIINMNSALEIAQNAIVVDIIKKIILMSKGRLIHSFKRKYC